MNMDVIGAFGRRIVNAGLHAGKVIESTRSIFKKDQRRRASVVLVVLLAQTTALYAHLARSIVMQRREREGRQITIDTITASIAHEVNQPLAAIVANANAGLRWLGNATPDLDEVRAALMCLARSERAHQQHSRARPPEIDGTIYVASRRPLRVGEFATVKIERAEAYDLHGTVVGF
jgi:signal transduction histidine kinase